jgi:2-(3-amino-3-carboxypropyl)histidine synthase
MKYEINYEKIKNKIKDAKAKNVLIQLPDGLKPDYKRIVKELEGDYNLFLWAASCFGACDIPIFTEKSGIDLIIHFGHEEFKC